MNLPVPGDPAAGHGPDADAEPAAEPHQADPARLPATRRQLDAIFGEVLPNVTRDELDDEPDRAGGDPDRWYRDNRPPHHG